MPAVGVRADDPGQLQIERIVIRQAANLIIGIFGMGVFQPQLVPVAERPGNVGRILGGVVNCILIVLDPVDKNPADHTRLNFHVK